MFYKTLAAATLALALTTGAMAQTSSGGQGGADGVDGAAGDSVQNPSAGAAAGQTPAETGVVQGGMTVDREFTSDNERMMFERNMPVFGGFFSDDTMSTLRTNEEMSASFSSLTPEQQQVMRDDCTNVTGDTSNSYGRSVIDLCTAVGAMGQ